MLILILVIILIVFFLVMSNSSTTAKDIEETRKYQEPKVYEYGFLIK